MNMVKLLGVLLLTALFGCEKVPEKKPVAIQDSHDSEIAQLVPLHDSDVLITVEDDKLTKLDFKHFANLKGEILLRTGQTLNGAMTPKQAYALGEEIFYGITNMFIREVALKKYAEEQGISSSTNHIQACRRGLARSLGMLGAKWDSVLKKLSQTYGGDQRATAEDRVASEALQLAVADRFRTEHPVHIDEQEVNRALKHFSDYNRRCSLTNAVIWATASNIWHRAESGESFEDLANQYNEDADKQPDGEWGEFKITDFKDEPELWKLSRHFRKGYISPPVEADNGLVIIRIDDITDASSDASASDYLLTPDAEIKISRIFLHLPQFIQTPDTTHFHEQFKNAKQNHAFESFVKGLISKVKVEFPQGMSIFERIKGNAGM